MPEFKGLKICWVGNGLHDYPDIMRVKIAQSGRSYSSAMHFGAGSIGGGGNSGFQALNLAVEWGARKVILIGYDMSERSGVHWYGRNFWPMSSNPDDSNFRRWLQSYNAAAPVLAGMGVEVVNASRDSALTCFPKRDLKDCV